MSLLMSMHMSSCLKYQGKDDTREGCYGENLVCIGEALMDVCMMISPKHMAQMNQGKDACNVKVSACALQLCV